MLDPPLSPHPLSYAQPEARQSPAGIISFVCGLFAVLSLCLALLASTGSLSTTTPLIRILIFATLVAITLLGLITGIVGLLPPHRKHALATIGLILNCLVSLVILLAIIGARVPFH
jgi:hypothetical protein